MSNILDALRKAQDEKCRVSNHLSTAREALLTNRPVRNRNRNEVNKRVFILAGSGVLLLGLVAWWLYGPSKPVSAPQTTDLARVAQSPAAPVPPVSNSAPSSSPLLPVTPIQSNTAKAALQPTQPVPSQVTTAHLGTENRPNLRKSEGIKKEPETATPSAPSTTVISSPPEGIKLTGIAWQDSRKMRRAVINDALVGEGTVVAGAKVLEIRPGLVRFEKNGTVFEAVLPH